MSLLDALRLPAMFAASQPPRTELPLNFLRLAFQTANPSVYQLDAFNADTASAEIVRKTLRRFNIKAELSANDRRWFRVNPSGAAVIFTEAACAEGTAALLVMTQATQPPKPAHLETTDYVPVFVFEGLFDRKSAFYRSAIHFETAEIPVDATFTPDHRTMVRAGSTWADDLNALAMGRKYFGQFLAGNRLRPDKAFPVIDQMGLEKLLQSYHTMVSREYQDSVIAQAERMPALS